MARLRRMRRADLDAPEPAPGLFESIAGFLTVCEAAERSPHTLRVYTWHLTAFRDAVGDVPVDQVKAEDVARHLVALREAGRAPATLSARHRVLSAFFHWCERDERVSRSPMRSVLAPKLPETFPSGFTHEEVLALLRACDQRTPTGARDHALVLTFLATGLRVSELLQIEKSDVVRAEAGEHIIRVMGKGQRERFVSLLPQAVASIQRYLRLRGPDDDEHLWIGERGPMTPTGVYQALRKRGEQAGIRNVHPHRFRREGLAEMVQKMDILEVQQIAGHASSKQLRHYIGHREQQRANDALLAGRHLDWLDEGAQKPKKKGR